MAPSGDRRVVYSTDGGRMRYCKRCGQAEHAGRCASSASVAAAAPLRVPNDGVIRIARDRKGRGGKTMTIITGLPPDEPALTTLAQTLKRMCGTGGTVKDGIVEIQGDHRERLAAYLTSLGHRVKLAGG
ncbi:MAG TPA: stress response translation initiation inhibitor YciH [Ktedonobacterales bacterium]|jgi:translation initiation factor 1|nr:stress response translation initiation inhibitor YciH [Ktedonobacterales bacterium]